MKQAKKRIILICSILAVLVLAVGGIAAALLQPAPAPQITEVSGEVQVSDEEALRNALKSKADCTITVTEDIVVSRELTVNGNKKLTGAGSIIMDLRRTGAGESVLAVSGGAVLTLDGVTVDGNGVASCVCVKAGGTFESESGSLIYGYPYGLDVLGTAQIRNVTIDEAMHTAINVAIFGKAGMESGTISNTVYGIAVAEEGALELGSGVVMKKNYASFIVNYGDAVISGGEYVGAAENAIENYGTMSIRGTQDNWIRIANGKKSGINSKNNAKLDAEYIEISDMGWHGMCVEKSSTATLKDVTVNNVGLLEKKSAFYVNSSQVEMHDITVNGGTAYALSANKDSKVYMYNATVRDVKHRGMTNDGSTVVIDGLTMERTAQHGIYTQGEKALTEISNATISEPGVSAVAAAGGKTVVKDSTIMNTPKEGVSIGKAGKAVLENVTITNAAYFGIGNYGGVTEATNVKIVDSGKAGIKAIDACTFSASGLIVKNSGAQAISLEGGSKATITGCEIYSTKSAAVYVLESTMTLKGAAIHDAGSYGIAVKNSPKALLNDIIILNSGEHGLGNINSYVVAGNITVNGTKRVGIYTEGASSVTNMNQIVVTNAGTCGFGFKGGKEITARNVTITDSKYEGIYALAGANVKKLDNVVIQNSGTHGISVAEGASVNVVVDPKYNPENSKENGVTIENSGKYGIYVQAGSSLKAAHVTVSGTTAQGIYVTGENATGEVSGFLVEDTGSAAVRVMKGAKVALTDGTVSSYNYGIATGGSNTDAFSEAVLTNVTVERADKDGKYTTNALVSVGKQSKVELTGTTVDGRYDAQKHAHEGRGIVVEDTGTLVMHSGTIQNNKAHASAEGGNGNGAGVLLKKGAAFTMNGGTIYNNIAANGGGVAMVSGTNKTPVFTMNGGSVTGNTALTNGGGLALTNGVFTMNSGAELTDNTAAKNGGGISMAGGAANARPSFILNGGKFTGNTAAGGADMNCTGGSAKILLQKPLSAPVYVKPNAYTVGRVMAEKSGNITDADFVTSMQYILVDANGEEEWIVTEEGKLAVPIVALNGVYYATLEDAMAVANSTEKEDTITILGDVEITEPLNVTENLKIETRKANGVTVSGGEAVDGSMLYVAAGKTLTVSGVETGKITFTSARTDKDVIVSAGALVLEHIAVSGGQKGVNIQAGGSLTASHVEVSATAAQGIYLTGTNATGTVSNFVLRENGSAAIRVMDGAKVTLTDGTVYAYNYGLATSGKTGTYSEAALTNVVMERAAADGKYTTSALISVGSNSKVEITGTTLDGKYTQNGSEGRGVLVEDAGTFVMHSGTIRNNKADTSVSSGNGAGVILKKGAAFTMNGGTITGNTANYGAGVAMIGGSNASPLFTMNGGTITGNNALTDGGAIALTNGIFTMNAGAEITGNTAAKNGGGITMAGGGAAARPTFILGGGKLSGNTAAGGADLNCTGGSAKILLQQALTSTVCVKPNTYADTRVMAEKSGSISDADFAASMKWIAVDANGEEKWFVAETGILAKAEAFLNATPYTSAAAALAAAQDGDTIQLCQDITLTEPFKKAVTLTADKAITVTANHTGNMLEIASGTLAITGVSETAKITLSADAKVAEMILTTGADANVVLTNVHIAGNNLAARAIRSNAGTVTAKNVSIADTTADGIHVKAGTTVNLDNVTVSNPGRYGIKAYGSVTISNTARADHALTIQNAYDHAIDVDAGATVSSNVSGAAGYVIRIDTTRKTSSIGILVRAGGSVNLSNVSIQNVKQQGVYFYGSSAAKTASGALAAFEVTGTGVAAVELKYSTASLTNGTITTGVSCITTDAGSTLTTANVTVKTTGTGAATNILGTKLGDEIIVVGESEA